MKFLRGVAKKHLNLSYVVRSAIARRVKPPVSWRYQLSHVETVHYGHEALLIEVSISAMGSYEGDRNG